MRYKDVQTGQTFFFEDNFSYPKRKTPHGHLDIRDDVTGYMPDDTPVITLAELAALTARVKELEAHLGRLLRLQGYSFVIPNKATGADNVESTIKAFDEARRALRGEA